MDDNEQPKRCTTSGRPWTEESRELLPNGQQKDYVILCEEERKKGFVRPVRTAYQHVGPTPPTSLRDLTPEELERYARYGYVKYEEYDPPRGSVVGSFWTQERLDRIGGCGTVTTMARSLAETYARDPGFYSGTFCVGCGKHFPVGEDGEFVWDGTDEKVGT